MGAEDGGALPPQIPTTRGPNPLGSIQCPHLPTLSYDPPPSEATNLAPCARSISLALCARVGRIGIYIYTYIDYIYIYIYIYYRRE